MVELLQKIDSGITVDGIIVGVIMYGIVHTIWRIILWFERRLQTEVGRVIIIHIKSGHKSRFKNCATDNCTTLGTGVSFQVTRHQPDSVQLQE